VQTLRIAVAHNLRFLDAEEQAEFDSQETIDMLCAAIERLGHQAEHFEMSESVLRLVSRLEAYHPDLIFNLAEGHHGRFREAFYPALFHELGFPYTGSDAYTLALTLDKHITKLLLRQTALGLLNGSS
jgi:D-alanine-D-alanine ligase